MAVKKVEYAFQILQGLIKEGNRLGNFEYYKLAFAFFEIYVNGVKNEVLHQISENI